ncbi:MAG TPA: ARMT1-like domain-containing protein [Aggregatilineales bacterium]|nr:ARMT1-like domain-containing protein [Aggregatilineales bacterium]
MALDSRRPAPIRTDSSNDFAHFSMKVRVPNILEEIQARNPDYPAPIHRALEKLSNDLANDAPIPMIGLPAPDYDDWTALYGPHAGESWLNTTWFFAELYLYRLVIEAVRWWETGRDPFAPNKNEELMGESLWKFLARSLETRELPVAERLGKLLHLAMWGNRIDLSYAASREHGHDWDADDMLVDDSAKAVQWVLDRPGAFHLVADNTGTELAADFALIAALLEARDEPVILHLKMHPIFVSDAMVPDALAFLDALDRRGSQMSALAQTLRDALTVGKLRLAPDLYWNQTRFLWDLPPRLQRTFEGAALVIFKGDANYRRVLGDAVWDPEIPFDEAVNYFPAPLLALRTLKSDPVVGLPPGMAFRLEASDPKWRLNGKRGLVQLAAKDAV